jgi:hypothetical protein
LAELAALLLVTGAMTSVTAMTVRFATLHCGFSRLRSAARYLSPLRVLSRQLADPANQDAAATEVAQTSTSPRVMIPQPLPPPIPPRGRLAQGRLKLDKDNPRRLLTRIIRY